MSSLKRKVFVIRHQRVHLLIEALRVLAGGHVDGERAVEQIGISGMRFSARKRARAYQLLVRPTENAGIITFPTAGRLIHRVGELRLGVADRIVEAVP